MVTIMEQHAVKDNDIIPSNEPYWLRIFVNTYQELSTDNLDLLEEIYHSDVTFVDPIHQIHGFDNLYVYFEKLYENLSSCHFTIDNMIFDNEQASIYWTMVYEHSTLNHGRKVTTNGCTHIKGSEGKVFYHRDYLDLGAMIYEQLPILGRVVKWIKKKAAQ